MTPLVKPDLLPTITLKKGAHTSPTEGMCVMEAVAYVQAQARALLNAQAQVATLKIAVDTLRAVARLYDHFGYEADVDRFDGTIFGWYCRGPQCGQPLGKPHLDDCPVAALPEGLRPC